MSDLDRLQRTLEAFDRANQADPNTTLTDGKAVPNEVLYAQRMSEMLFQFAPEASEILQLAARSQHICRWKIPRSDYPMDRAGYKKWRTSLAQFHATTAADIMTLHGYEADQCTRVGDLLLKRGLKRDDEVQMLEDVICLVFIQFYLLDFSQKHSEEKLIDIIQKTWNKMSAQGHQAALQLAPQLPTQLQTLIAKALA